MYSLQKLAQLLKTGDDDQLQLVLGELPQLLEHCAADTYRIVVPSLCEEVPKWTPELQVQAGKGLLLLSTGDVDKDIAKLVSTVSFRIHSFVHCSIVRKRVPEANSYMNSRACIRSARASGRIHQASLLIVRGVEGIVNPNTESLYEVFGEVAMKMMPLVQWSDSTVQAVFDLVDSRFASPFPEDRRAAATILYGLCVSETVEEELRVSAMGRMWLATGDSHDLVVARTISVFGKCAATLTSDDMEKLCSVLKRAWNAHSGAQGATAARAMLQKEALGCLCALTKTSLVRGAVVGPSVMRDLVGLAALVIRFAGEYADTDQRDVSTEVYDLTVAVASRFGELVEFGVRNSPEDFFRDGMKKVIGLGLGTMARSNGPMIRSACAGNLALIASLFPRHRALRASLSEYFAVLCRDNNLTVRRAVSANLEDTIDGLSARNTADALHEALEGLLQDEDMAVRQASMAALVSCWSSLARVGALGPGQWVTKTVFEAASRSLSGATWRLKAHYARFVSQTAFEAEPTVMEKSIIPALMEFVAEGPARVRIAGCASLLAVARASSPESLCDARLIDLLDLLASGTSYHLRLALVETSVMALEMFSEVVFERIFANRVLRLASDPVSNVRRALAGAMPAFAPWCQGLEAFEPALQNLREDADKDVRECMETFVTKASQYVSLGRRNESMEYNRRAQELEFHKSRSGSNDSFILSPIQTTASRVGTAAPKIVEEIGAHITALSQDTSKMASRISLTRARVEAGSEPSGPRGLLYRSFARHSVPGQADAGGHLEESRPYLAGGLLSRASKGGRARVSEWSDRDIVDEGSEPGESFGKSGPVESGTVSERAEGGAVDADTSSLLPEATQSAKSDLPADEERVLAETGPLSEAEVVQRAGMGRSQSSDYHWQTSLVTLSSLSTSEAAVEDASAASASYKGVKLSATAEDPTEQDPISFSFVGSRSSAISSNLALDLSSGATDRAHGNPDSPFEVDDGSGADEDPGQSSGTASSEVDDRSTYGMPHFALQASEIVPAVAAGPEEQVSPGSALQVNSRRRRVRNSEQTGEGSDEDPKDRSAARLGALGKLVRVSRGLHATKRSGVGAGLWSKLTGVLGLRRRRETPASAEDLKVEAPDEESPFEDSRQDMPSPRLPSTALYHSPSDEEPRGGDGMPFALPETMVSGADEPQTKFGGEILVHDDDERCRAGFEGSPGWLKQSIGHALDAEEASGRTDMKRMQGWPARAAEVTPEYPSRLPDAEGGASDVQHTLSRDRSVARENLAVSETAEIQPGMVSSLLRKWESMEPALGSR